MNSIIHSESLESTIQNSTKEIDSRINILESKSAAIYNKSKTMKQDIGRLKDKQNKILDKLEKIEDAIKAHEADIKFQKSVQTTISDDIDTIRANNERSISNLNNDIESVRALAEYLSDDVSKLYKLIAFVAGLLVFNIIFMTIFAYSFSSFKDDIVSAASESYSTETTYVTEEYSEIN